MSSKDNLGDKLKDLEQIEAGRKTMKGLPLMARLDGRSFSEFTKGFDRPFDADLSAVMIETVKFLVSETQAKIGYTQSDEITLFWYEDYESTSEYMFDGKYQKLVSTLAALASTKFNRLLSSQLISIEKYIKLKLHDKLPTFDCRVWQVPTMREVYLNFLWREQDATKNAISMAAHHCLGHSILQGKTGPEKVEMLFQVGVNFGDYPESFRRGSYVRRRKFLKKLTQDELNMIPERHRPTEPVERSEVVNLELPLLSRIANASDFLLHDSDIIQKAIL